MKKGRSLRPLSIAVMALLSACGAEQTAPPDISVIMFPTSAAVFINESLHFSASVWHSPTDSSVTWSLSGAGCSGAACGTVSDAGIYTAPAAVPNPAAVTITATSVADPTKSASATITILEVADVWAWMSGSQSPWQMGIYGTQGVADPANAPGSREWAAAWADAGGNLWLFGGTGYSAVDSGGLNDLWKYDGANWTWVLGSNLSNQPGVYGTKGVADPANHPGATSAAGTWVDSGGKFWLLSGSLWEFDPLTLLWTWVSGSQVQPQGGVYGTQGIPDPANVPGSRGCTATWVDPEDNLWLYGGVGYDWDGMRGTLGDLWKFDTSTLMWTWISGSKTAAWKNDGNPTGLPAIYGTKGVPDPTSFPGSRLGAVSWADAGGPLWLFGGVASHWTATDDQLHNDLWKFDPLTREWTWVSGSNAMAQPGIYGTKGVADASNIPGARKYAVSWTDPDGNFWLFGGFGYYAAGQTGYLNDLWKFDPITQEWTWVSGSDIGDQPGYFGPKGHNLASNMPPARVKAASWVDAAGNLWLFGGGAYWSFQSQACESNDLWRYTR